MGDNGLFNQRGGGEGGEGQEKRASDRLERVWLWRMCMFKEQSLRVMKTDLSS